MQAQLNKNCQVTVNGQTVNVGFGGEFRIRNIPAGPNLVRVYAICAEDGKTRYGRSGFFQIFNNLTVHISELDLVWQDMPFPTTSSMTAIPEVPTLTDSGQTTQIGVTATLSDGTQKDVTLRGFGSTYSSSNPAIATVDENGLVTAVNRGIAFITVNNEGATAVTSVVVSPGDSLTTVEGFVFNENDQPIEGAFVEMLGTAGASTTGPDGRFSVSGVATQLGKLSVLAKAQIGEEALSGLAFGFEPIESGFTDAGIIVPNARNGLIMKMYDTNGVGPVGNGFEGLQAGQFTVRTATETTTDTIYTLPLINFPDTDFDTQAFYNHGPNNVREGTSATTPLGDDISIAPPGGMTNFGASFTGFMLVPQDVPVTFTVGVDDAFDLIIDGTSVLRFIGTTNFRNFRVTLNDISAGIVPIILNYGQGPIEADVVLSASGGGFPGGVILPNFLFVEDPTQ